MHLNLACVAVLRGYGHELCAKSDVKYRPYSHTGWTCCSADVFLSDLSIFCLNFLFELPFAEDWYTEAFLCDRAMSNIHHDTLATSQLSDLAEEKTMLRHSSDLHCVGPECLSTLSDCV